MISAQKEVEFAKSDYDNLKPVRSIRICMDAGDNEDSINRIRFVQDTVFGKDIEYSCAAEPPIRCGVSHLSGQA